MPKFDEDRSIGPGANRMPKVESALEWAYQQGCTLARPAIDEYVAAAGIAWCVEDLGQYPDIPAFFDTQAEADAAIGSTAWGKYRKPRPV